jgi:hypothetical protein
VGYSVALGEHLAAGPDRIRARLAELGQATRTALADVAGWRVVEPVGRPTAITTLTPLDGADPQKVVVADRRALDRHHIRRGAARTVRAARAGAAGIAARRQRHRGLGGLRRGAGGGDGNYCRNYCEIRTVSLS